MSNNELNIKNIDELLGGVKDIWKQKQPEKCLFWSSLANSYYNNEELSNSQNKFYSKISFYPNLIKYLTNNIKIIEEFEKVEITFFSTLLPRHYWNFPIPKRLTNWNGDEKNYFFSTTKSFLESYRNIISQSIQKEKIKLKRVLIVGDEKFFLNNTYLFSFDEFKSDANYFLNYGESNSLETEKIQWKSLFNHKNPNQIDTKRIEYSSGCDHDNFIHLFGHGRKLDGAKEVKQILQDRDFYIFQNKFRNVNQISLLDYYLKNLHSKDEAKLLIINKEDRKISSPITFRGTRFSPTNKHKLNIDSFNLDSCLIKIGDKELILNTFMDTFNNIVKLKIIESTEGKNFLDLKSQMDSIIKLSSPIIDKRNPRTRKSRTVKTPK